MNVDAETEWRASRLNLPPVPLSLKRAASWSWRLLVCAAAAFSVLVVLRYLSVIVLPVMFALTIAPALTPVAGTLRRRLGRPAAAVALLFGLAVVAGLIAIVAISVLAQYDELVDSLSRASGRHRRPARRRAVQPLARGNRGRQLVACRLRGRSPRVRRRGSPDGPRGCRRRSAGRRRPLLHPPGRSGVVGVGLAAVRTAEPAGARSRRTAGVGRAGRLHPRNGGHRLASTRR